MTEAFLEVLANPLEPDRPRLRRVGDLLVCSKTGVGFPIIQGIPHLLPEDMISAEEVQRQLGPTRQETPDH
jgi:uncharacterized protein YbaR (Trm112 family)